MNKEKNPAKKRNDFSFVDDNLRQKYESITGFPITDRYLKGLYNQLSIYHSFGSLLSSQAGEKQDFEGVIIGRIEFVIDNWNRGEVLNALKSNGYILLENDRIPLDPKIIGQYQHMSGIILMNAGIEHELKHYILVGASRRGIPEGANITTEQRKEFIEAHYVEMIRRYESNEYIMV